METLSQNPTQQFIPTPQPAGTPLTAEQQQQQLFAQMQQQAQQQAQNPLQQPQMQPQQQPLQQPALAQPALVKATEVPAPTRGKLIYQQTWTLTEYQSAHQLAGIDICPTSGGKWAFCDLTKPIGQQILGAVANSVPNKGFSADNLRISFCVDSVTGETMHLLHVKQEAMVSHQKLI
tara:strand:- start:191 stop:721 length:531 start_codon:yes stop_codon:yes gene_type:complete